VTDLFRVRNGHHGGIIRLDCESLPGTNLEVGDGLGIPLAQGADHSGLVAADIGGGDILVVDGNEATLDDIGGIGVLEGESDATLGFGSSLWKCQTSCNEKNEDEGWDLHGELGPVERERERERDRSERGGRGVEREVEGEGEEGARVVDIDGYEKKRCESRVDGVPRE
jgi:hypothetical protein